MIGITADGSEIVYFKPGEAMTGIGLSHIILTLDDIQDRHFAEWFLDTVQTKLTPTKKHLGDWTFGFLESANPQEKDNGHELG